MVIREYLDTKIRNIGRIALANTVAAALLLGLAACGNTDTGATTQPTAITTVEVPAATNTETTNIPADTSTAVPAAIETETPDMMDMGGASMDATATPAVSGAEATPTPAQQAGASTGADVQVQATIREWAIDLSQQEVAAGKVTFVVSNTGQFAHNFAVTDSNGEIAKTSTFSQGDGPQSLEVDLQPGTYTIVCTLPGHAARGQSVQLVDK
jgi:uncharacterized cupredoxin-like copper-binding protein